MASTRSRQAAWTLALVLACAASLALFGWLVTRPDDRGAPEQELFSLVRHRDRLPDYLKRLDVDGYEVSGYETTTDLESTASELVHRYGDEEACVVQCAGYLGLLGTTWACVMEGPGWVDICVVRQQEQGCVVRTARLTPEEWEGMDGT